MFAVIHLPDFFLQAALRHEPDLRSRPVALMDPRSPKSGLLELTAAARRCGVQAGMTASQAAARCGDLLVRPRSPALEASATEVLLQAAYAFSPNIESTAPGICTMGLQGLGLADETAAGVWAEKILKNFASLHLEAQAGFGPTPELALLAARSRQGRSLQPMVGSLPLSALDPAPEVREVLSRWGIRTVGEFLALGRKEVAERLGRPALELFERVSPRAVRPLRRVSPPEHFSEQIEFEHEIETVEPLLFVLRRFVEQLARRLEQVYLVVAEFQLHLGLASGDVHARTFKVPSPTGEIETLFRMLQTHLETVRTESSIVSLRLSARPARPEKHQFALFESTLQDPNQFAETLARLTALVGPENVGTPALETTHRPDAFRMQPPRFDPAPGAPAAGPGTLNLPLRRFRPPLRAQLEFQDERPASVRSESFTGAVVDRRGPFLGSGDWWDDRRWAREEWDVELAGGRLLRVYRSADGCFVEGVYD